MIRALRIHTPRRYRHLYVQFREWILDSLTLIPVLCIVGGVFLAGSMWLFHRYLFAQPYLPPWIYGSTAAAITVVSVVASSMLSFLAVVFSVTLVALQLASQQFSPRVLRTFVRSPIAKVTLGLATGTFAYSLLILFIGIYRQQDTALVPALAVDVILVFVTTVVFVLFIKQIVTMMRIAYIISFVATETHASIQHVFPPAEAYCDCPDVVLGEPKQVIAYKQSGRLRLIKQWPEGAFQSVDNPHLTQLAKENGAVIRVLPLPGDYIVQGAPVMEVYGDGELAPQQCLATFFVEPERNLEQDPAYGFRVLVDIALQALSPAVNAPTTATQVLHRLTALLLDIARRPPPTGHFADAGNTVRLVRPMVTWPEYVDLAFTEIIEFGASCSQVRTALERAIDELLAEVTPERRPPLEAQKQTLLEAVKAL